MDLLNETELYDERLKATGAETQYMMAIEECSELIEAICHFRRGRIPARGIAEEVADVLLMACQLRHMIGPKVVDKQVEFKIRRLKERNNAR